MSDLHVYLRLGWHNLWLYPLRTGLSIVALALGIAALTFLTAMNDGWVQQVKSNFAMLLMGHIQVHAAGFQDNRSLKHQIENPDLITSQLDAEPMVAGWTRRVRASGLASTASANAGVRVFAVEPERELTLSHMGKFIQQGRWLRNEDEHVVILGKGLADRLQAGLGNKVVLMVALGDGDIVSEVFRVRGVLYSGVMALDNYAAIIPLHVGQRWLGLEKAVTDVVIFSHDQDSVQPLVGGLRERYAGKGLEVLSWLDIDPMTWQWSQLADTTAWIIMSVVIFVVMAEVLNTMLMSMHDRTRELGMMTALGVTQRQIFAMILCETLMLVVTGSLVGFALGAWVSAYFGVHGIDLSRYAIALSFSFMESVVYPQLSLDSVKDILGATVVGALVAGLFPAWKAARLDPAVAMRVV